MLAVDHPYWPDVNVTPPERDLNILHMAPLGLQQRFF